MRTNNQQTKAREGVDRTALTACASVEALAEAVQHVMPRRRRLLTGVQIVGVQIRRVLLLGRLGVPHLSGRFFAVRLCKSFNRGFAQLSPPLVFGGLFLSEMPEFTPALP